MPASPQEPNTNRPKVKTRTPRPDELSRETFEFITAVDDYKRRHLRSFLKDNEILAILAELGYSLPGQGVSEDPSEGELEAFAAARLTYREEAGRLFPTWSEVFELLAGLGYSRNKAA